MKHLTDIPNIGKKLSENLNMVGIHNIEDLKKTGSKESWMKIRQIDSSACINMLFALEGAIQNTRWHSLSKDTKEELKSFFQMVQ
jgi:DNA transformation protein and related proteins